MTHFPPMTIYYLWPSSTYDASSVTQQKVFCVANDNLQGLGFLTGSAALQDVRGIHLGVNMSH